MKKYTSPVTFQQSTNHGGHRFAQRKNIPSPQKLTIRIHFFNVESRLKIPLHSVNTGGLFI